jgi:hypothetical protein
MRTKDNKMIRIAGEMFSVAAPSLRTLQIN